MNPVFISRVAAALAVERLEAYRQDGVTPGTALARYLLNLALCESLYTPLHLVEVALRNTLHATLTVRYQHETWYETASVPMSSWQQATVTEARRRLTDRLKPVTPGRIVAELNFGFWTGFFNKRQARTGLGFYLARYALPHAPREERDLAKLDARCERLRGLRNRVFHHERILHYTDLEVQYAELLKLLGWISPELYEMALALDRFSDIRREGLPPWIGKIQHHWPHPTPPVPPAAFT